MTALEILSIDGSYNLQIASLDGLIAPRLRELYGAGIGLTDIQALAGNTALEVVILGGNQQMGDIPPLQASAASLKQLEISSTAIADLAVLAEAGKLEESAAAPVKEALEGLIQEQGSKFANGKSVRRLFEQVQTN